MKENHSVITHSFEYDKENHAPKGGDTYDREQEASSP